MGVGPVPADLETPVPTARESGTAGPTLRLHRERVSLYVRVLWNLLRYVFALAGFVCLLLTVTTLTGWFTVSSEGEQLEWYWLLIAAFMLGLLTTIGDEPFLGVSGAGPRLGAPDQRLAPSLVHPIRRIFWTILVAGAWGGLTYLLGLDLIVILAVAALVGLGYAFRRPREGGTVEQQKTG